MPETDNGEALRRLEAMAFGTSSESARRIAAPQRQIENDRADQETESDKASNWRRLRATTFGTSESAQEIAALQRQIEYDRAERNRAERRILELKQQQIPQYKDMTMDLKADNFQLETPPNNNFSKKQRVR
jgi:cell division protein FtsB